MVPDRVTTDGHNSSCSLQDCEHRGWCDGDGAGGGDWQEHVGGDGAEAEEGAEFVIPSTKPLGGTECLEASHTSDPTFDAPVILLQAIVSIGAGPGVLHMRPSVERIARGLG
jgi:hypothetical protein